ncbi:MAG: nucleotide exchange factor GrpE [Candidatus Aminicenantes bacterium]|nr:nucleotide exchange factor GrpE [Candidatus Aminicenantes bacterium]
MKKKSESESEGKQKKIADDNDIEIEYITEQGEEEQETQKTRSQEKGDAAEEVKDLQKQFKELKEKNKKLKEQYLREAAEKDNLRKRTEKEKNEYFQYALSEVFREIISILDNFDRALEKKEEGEQKQFREGIELIHKQLQTLLKNNGIKPIEIKEDKFDPRYHEALMSEEASDVEEPSIGEVIQKGYMIHQRLLRPTLVKVKVPKKKD